MELRPLAWKVLAAGRGRRILLAGAILALLLGGVLLRRTTWEETTHLRFQRDIVNGFYWGSQTVALGQRLSPGENPDSWRAFARGYIALYDQVGDDAYEGNYGLDYPPLRLLVMSIWAKEVRAKFPGVEDGTPDYVRPLLHVNLLCEMVTAAGIFLLVRRGLRRASGATDSPLFRRVSPRRRATVCGLVAASVVWFDPSLILDTHAWPQWDVWILPFFLFAALAALTRRWFWCGCLLAAGGMLKGQLLFVAPFFLFWPLWQKRWVRALHLVAGFVFGSALFVLPWLLRNASSWCLVATVAGLTAAVLFRRRSRNAAPWTAGVTAVAAFIVGAVNGGSFGWLTIGFLYGSEHYPYLFISSCYNLPSLLADWGWSLKAPLWSLNLGALHLSLTLQWALRLFYLLALVLCALGAARHTRHREPRLLIALAAPWLLMFALLAQMHERYLLWGAVLSAVALGVSLRLSVLHFFFSAMSAAMITHVLLVDKKLGPTLGLIDLLEKARPYASWLFLGCVAIWVWDTFSSRPPSLRLRPVSTLPKEKVGLSLAAAAEKV
jgi:hypothetical protein